MFCQYQHIAIRLYECGVKVVPEGAVVLTKEEYEKLKALPEKVHNEMDERMKEELAIEKRMGEKKAEQARKETAMEVLKKVDDESNGQTIMVTNYIRKKYGVEVEE